MTAIPSDSVTNRLGDRLKRVTTVSQHGRIQKVEGTMVRAAMDNAFVGEECLLEDPHSGTTLRAEVIGIEDGHVILAPGGTTMGLSTTTAVIGLRRLPLSPAGQGAIGRVIDPFGGALDGGEAISPSVALYREPPRPLMRPPIEEALSTGVRSIDAMMTTGKGQRVGIFGAAGVGKSKLLSQIIRGTSADVIVLGLIGERGREVREFLDKDLGEEGRARTAVVVSTSDRPAMERLRAAYAATAIAEDFRDQGKSVLLLIDSMTRVARAVRELGLAAGEPPVRRGFPPSTFTVLPRLVERAGRDASGDITAMYTVLVEGDDDNNDPVADELRSLLDGHIILSRDLAARGHFPAIDVLKSNSRVMQAVVDGEHAKAATTVAQRVAKFQDIEFLMQVGEYQSGSDADADVAIESKAAIDQFLQQTPDDLCGFEDMRSMLQEVTA